MAAARDLAEWSLADEQTAREMVRGLLVSLESTRAELSRARARERGLLQMLAGLVIMYPQLAELIPAELRSDLRVEAAKT